MSEQPIPATLFTVLGVPWTGTRNSWQFIPPKLVIGIVVALVALPNEPPGLRIGWGLVYGGLLLSILCLHIVGHILSSRWVVPPMTEARITPILIETRYGLDGDAVPSRTHLIRSIGGPFINLGAGSMALLLWRVYPFHPILFFAGANFVLAAFVLLPFPTVDGEVIWRELRKLYQQTRLF